MKVVNYFSVIMMVCSLSINFSEIFAMERPRAMERQDERPRPVVVPSQTLEEFAREILDDGRRVIQVHGGNTALVRACAALDDCIRSHSFLLHQKQSEKWQLLDGLLFRPSKKVQQYFLDSVF